MVNAFALAVAATVAALSSAQEIAPIPSARAALAERVIELVSDASWMPFEDVGPSTTVAHDTFDPPGRLYIWATAENADVWLRLEDAGGAELARDDDSGGKPAPFIAFDVLERRTLTVRVAVHGAPVAGTRVELHVASAPDPEVIRNVSRAAAGGAQRARELAGAGKFDEAFAELARARDHLDSVAPSEWAWSLSDAWKRVLLLAGELNDVATFTQAANWMLARAEHVYPPEHLDRVRALGFVARARELGGDVRGAFALQQRVFAACERTLPEEHPSRTTAAMNLASLACGVGEFQTGLDLYRGALAAIEKSGRGASLDAEQVRMNLALTLSDMGRFSAARTELEHVVAASGVADSPSKELAGIARVNLGCVLVALEEYGTARTELETAITVLIPSSPQGHPTLVLAYAALAEVTREEGDLETARSECERLLVELAGSTPDDHPNVLRLRVCLGSTYRMLDDSDAARAQFERVLALVEPHGPRDPNWFVANANLALTLQDVGNFVGARALLQRVLAVAMPQLGRTHPQIVAVRGNLATALQYSGELVAARDLFEELIADSTSEYSEDHPRRITLLANLSNVLGEIELTPRVIALASEVLERRERVLGPRHVETQRARRNLGFQLMRSGDLVAAQPLLEGSLTDCERELGDDHPDVLHARGLVLSLANRIGDVSRARAVARDLARGIVARAVRAAWLAPLEAREAIADLDRSAAQVASALASGGDTDRKLVFELLETMRAAADLAPRTARMVRSTPELAQVADAIAGVRGEIATARARADTDAVAQLALQRDTLERQLQARLAQLGSEFGPVRTADVAATLGEGEAAVTYRRIAIWSNDAKTGEARDEQRLLAHVVRRDGSVTRLDLGAAPALERAVVAWRSSLERSAEPRGLGATRAVDATATTGDERELAGVVRAALLDAVLAASGPSTHSLRVCADDLVHLVPLDALPLGAGLAGDHVRIRLRSSLARVARPAPAEITEPCLLAFGDAAFGAPRDAQAGLRAGDPRLAFGPLPGTRAEVAAIAGICSANARAKTAVFGAEAATKAALVANAPRARYLHLATHGWFAADDIAPEPAAARAGVEATLRPDQVVAGVSPGLLCGLALAGANAGRDPSGRVPGIVTADELAGLDLSHCELAVLSACETHVGARRAGLGLRSLQSAVHAAGARVAIASLWKVDDAGARRLMERFYTLLWKDGFAPGEALWRAKLAARAANEPAAVWAGWVLSESGQ